MVSDQNVPSYPSVRSWGGNSAPHKADFGKRAPLTPHLAQPKTKIWHNYFFARKMFGVQRFRGSEVQRFKGSGVQGFKVQRFRVQRFKVQRFKFQRFRVQRSGFRIVLDRIQALLC